MARQVRNVVVTGASSGAGRVGLALPLDVANAAAVSEIARRVIDEWGGIDVSVDCAMVCVFLLFAR